MSISESGRLKFCRELQPLKAPRPISVTSEKVTLRRDLQFAKTSDPIIWRNSGMATLTKELHPLKASSPIPVTEFGMSRVLKDVQPLKALARMAFRESGKVTRVNDIQPAKASKPIWWTELGMVTNSSKLHSWKALCSIWSISSGIYTATNSFAARPEDSLLAATTALTVKSTSMFESSERPSWPKVNSSSSCFLPSSSSSTTVMRRMTLSLLGCKAFSFCLRSPMVISGMTSTSTLSPLICITAIFMAMATATSQLLKVFWTSTCQTASRESLSQRNVHLPAALGWTCSPGHTCNRLYLGRHGHGNMGTQPTKRCWHAKSTCIFPLGGTIETCKDMNVHECTWYIYIYIYLFLTSLSKCSLL